MQNSPRPDDAFVPTQKDIEDYSALKNSLLDALRKEGSLFVTKKSSSGYVGLTNQGATVFLNSLLQALYNITDVKNAVFKYKGDSPVLKEFQRLFAMLRLSDHCATTTAGITSALGWNSVEFFESRDIQEILALLIDTLGTSSNELKTELSSIFQGSKKDVMVCPDCKTRTETASPFVTISLDILEATESLEESVDRSLPGLTVRKLIQSCSAPTPISADTPWVCMRCAKNTRANKSIEYTQLPPVVAINLNRFQNDPVTRRKVKLSHPVLFTDTLLASDIQPGATGQYKLKSILMHSGPAKGGHYKVMIRDAMGTWVEFDDSIVNTLENADVSSLFWYNGQNASAGDTSASDLIYEAAYMLIFERDGPIPQSILVPTNLEKEVEESNALLSKLRDAYRVHQQMVELKTYVISGSMTNVVARNAENLALYLPRALTLREATAQAFEQAKALNLGVTKLENCRLRRYDPATDRLGETFGSREGQSLQLLKLYPSSTMALEIRTDSEAFEEFNPNLMLLRILVWDGQAKSGAEAGSISGRSIKVVVPGEDKATVGALRTAAATALSTAVTQVALVRSDHTTVFELRDDSKILRADFHVWPGDEIVVEILPEGSTFTSAKEAGVLTALRSGKKNIRVFFNNPVEGTVTSVDADYSSVSPRRDDYPHYLDTTLDTILGDVKSAIALKLGVPLKSFHIRRSAAEPQLKDDSKTMKDYEISNNGVLHLQVGPGCELGEHMLRLELDLTPDSALVSGPADIIPIGELAVKEKASVAQVKALILDRWDVLVGPTSVPRPPSTAHIKLRDGKGTSVSLRDERVMSRCLLNMQDGRKLVIHVLNSPLTITNNDIILTLRLATYAPVEGGPEKGVSRPLEVIIPKSSTVKSLMDLIAARFPHLAENPPLTLIQQASEGDDHASDLGAIAPTLQNFSRQYAVAKAFSSGPALTLREIQKLKWNDALLLGNADLELSKEPLALRDGAVIVVRGQTDYLRAKVAAKSKREAEGESAPARPSSRSSVGRPRSRGVTMRAKPKEVITSKVPPPPEASLESGLPTTPSKRMVKSLRDEE